MAISLGGFSGGGGAGSDTLDDVTGRGATTTNAITVGGVSIGSAFSLPTSDGSANQVLQTNGSGSLSFATLDFTGGLEYKGSFNATAGTPSLATAQKGDYYKIDTAGTIYGQTWAVNDSLIINADMGGSITNSKIDKIDNSEPTNVLITTNNLNDLDNVATAKTNLGLQTVASTGAYSDLSGTPTLGTAAAANTGTGIGQVVIMEDVGSVAKLPALDGSQLINITANDSTRLAKTQNLNDLTNKVTARQNLGVEIGVDVQAYDAQLADVAGLATTDSGFIVGNGSNFVLETGATVRTSLGLQTVASTGAYSDLSGTPTLGTASASASTDFLSATGADSLGGNLNVNGHDLISSSNGDIEIAPDGTGSFIIKGNATSGSGRVVLNCEQNSHGITLKGPAHSAQATYQLVFPTSVGTSGQVLKTDGGDGGSPNSVQLAWVDQSGGGGGSTAPTVITDSTGTDTTITTSSGIEEVHLISNGANNVTITIPGATSAGYKYNIKRLGAGTVTIQASSGTIDTAANFSIASKFDSLTVVSDATNYHII